MTKYVKLKSDHSDFDSAVYSVRPRQLRSISTSDYKNYDWFIVEEHYEFRTDAQLYRYVRSSWELNTDGKVHIYYVPELVGLDMRRSIMSQRCTEMRDRKIAGGIVFKGHTFDTRPATYIRIAGAVIKAMRDATFTTNWITEENKTVQLTNQDILDLGDAYAAFESQNIMFARDLKDQVEISDAPETFVIDSGWPANEFFTTETLTVIS